MSDLDTLKAILDRGEILYAPGETDARIPDGSTVIEVRAGSGRGNPIPLGYNASFAELHFDADGALIAWANWE